MGSAPLSTLKQTGASLNPIIKTSFPEQRKMKLYISTKEKISPFVITLPSMFVARLQTIHFANEIEQKTTTSDIQLPIKSVEKGKPNLAQVWTAHRKNLMPWQYGTKNISASSWKLYLCIKVQEAIILSTHVIRVIR